MKGYLFVLAIVPVVAILGRPSTTTDFDCEGDYDGKCYECHYQEDVCHRSTICVHYKNGNIYTVDKKDKTDTSWSTNPQQSIVIVDGIIEFVGKDIDGAAFAEQQTKKCKTVDLKKKTILPGLHDVHMHPMEVGSEVGGTCSMPSNTLPNAPEMVKSLEDGCYEDQKGTDWVLGNGHSIHSILEYLKDENARDPKEILDDFLPETPIIILEETSHSVWVNSAALKKANISGPNPQDVIGGKIMLNKNNEANGILLENAGNWINDMAFDQTKYPDLIKEADKGLYNGLATLAQNGITSYVDARCYWGRDNHKSYERFQDQNKMTARTVLSMWAYPNARDDDAQIETLKGFYDNTPGSMVKRTQIKFYEDGLIGTRTARVLDAYLDDTPELGIGKHGYNYFTQERLSYYLSKVQSFKDNGEGYDIHVHSVGDAAAREILNAIEENKLEGTRHRLTHVEMVHEADIPRFSQLHTIADAQVAGNFAMPKDPSHETLVTLIGEEKSKRNIPIRDLLASGATVTLSSDYDVSPVNPFLGMSHAITRGDQSVNLSTALEMYTINAAFVMRQEGTTGSLEVGKQADLIVIDQDIFHTEAKDIPQTKVLQTIVGGEEVYRADGFP